MTAELPSWIIYSQALATPIIGILTGWIAFRQYRLAKQHTKVEREKLKHDLYDRRYAIYLAFEKMLRVMEGQTEIGDEKDLAIAANIAAHQASFVLDGEMHKYLLNLSLSALKTIEMRDNENPELTGMILLGMEGLPSLVARGEELTKKFIPFLKLDDFRNEKS